jgi:hypothetical protein
MSHELGSQMMEIPMFRLMLMVAGCCLVQLIASSPSTARDKPPTRGSPSTQIYFKAQEADGAPIYPLFCGHNSTKKGWLSRDLGVGLNVEVGIDYEEERPVSATLLFRYFDGELKVLPDNIELRVLPGERTYKPSKVHRDVYVPNGTSCQQHGEWVRLEFPVQARLVENVELVIPYGAVTKRDILKIRPFRFQKSVE